MTKRLFAIAGVGIVAAGSFAAFALSDPQTPSAAPIAVAAVATAAAPTAAGGQPVLVELFTSQGCSSCPPADAVLATIANDPGVIAISRPVTYWDRLGWKDTLAREDNTTLQRAYATKGHKGAGVYTPQAVVQGAHGVVGSQQEQVRALIATARKVPQPTLTVANDAGGRTLSIDGAGSGQSSVTLVALKADSMVSIGNGENGGRKVRYTNVVLDETPVGKWSGGKMSFKIPASALKVSGADRYALIVQQGPAGKVVAARYL